MTSLVTWPFDSWWATIYGSSIVTMRLSCTVMEIWSLKCWTDERMLRWFYTLSSAIAFHWKDKNVWWTITHLPCPLIYPMMYCQSRSVKALMIQFFCSRLSVSHMLPLLSYCYFVLCTFCRRVVSICSWQKRPQHVCMWSWEIRIYLYLLFQESELLITWHLLI